MRQLIFAVILAAGLASAQNPRAIAPNGRVYIDVAGDLNGYIAGALRKKGVALTVVTDKSKADYKIETVSAHGSDAACIQFANGTDEVLFAYWVEPKDSRHGHQAVAESFAGYLRNTMRAAEAGPGVIKVLLSTEPAPELNYR